MTMVFSAGVRATVASLGASLLLAGCGLDDVDAPPLSGPSDFALAVTLAATPDSIPRDGLSQSVVTVTVRNPSGQTVSGQRLSVATTLGAVSQSQIVTGADGRATFSFTAPAAASLGNAALIRVTPIGTNAENAEARTLTIALTGTSNSTLPTAAFTVAPASPEVNQVATLDASTSTDEGAACGSACNYFWDLGGEATRTGRLITYQFQAARVYNVALTVTDAAGASATTRTNVTVTAAARPTVAFTFSPTAPVAGQITAFTATTTVGTNHRISRFDWTWGDGSTTQTSNAATTHSFSSPGSYVVTVVATDDLGQAASSTTTVPVSSGVTASFSSSPTNPRQGDTIQFNGSPSTAPGGATIKEWTWDFGDGTAPVTEEDATTTHVFTSQRTFVVRLTVKDSQGRTGTTTSTITIAAP